MAANVYTITKETVAGDMRCQIGYVTTDDAPTAEVATGLSYLYGGTATSQTLSTAAPGLTLNGVTAGKFNLAGGANSSIYHVVLFGR